jgi:uncharacterized protein YjbJ (UPF0337 family)
MRVSETLILCCCENEFTIQNIVYMEHTPNKPSGAFKMTGNWDEQSKQLKSKFTQLTDDDLKFETGKENDLLKRVENRLHKNREEVINIIKTVQPKTF